MARELTWQDIVKKEFNPPSRGAAGYDEIAVDDFFDEVVRRVHADTLTTAFLRAQTFPKAQGFGRRGYAATDVDEFIDHLAQQCSGVAPFTGSTVGEQQDAPRQNAPQGGGTSSWGGESSISGESPYVERKSFLSRIFGKG